MSTLPSRTGRFGLVTLTLGGFGEPPFGLDAMVVAQDRGLLLDPTTPVEDSPRSYRALIREADAIGSGARPGSVLVRRGPGPLRMWAVIHDLDTEPSCRPEWVEAALHSVLREVAHRGLGTLSLPALGCAERVLEPDAFLRLLADAIAAVGLVSRLQVWLTVPGDLRPAAARALAALDF